MKPEEAIEIISNYRPGCGEKITYAEGEVCEADDARRSPIDLEYCPVGYDRCDSNCCFYEED